MKTHQQSKKPRPFTCYARIKKKEEETENAKNDKKGWSSLVPEVSWVTQEK